MKTVAKEIFINIEDFNLKDTFECGQCFRWDRQEDGSYTGVIMGRVLNIKQADGGFVIKGTDEEEFNRVFKDYFDLDTDYSKIKKSLSCDRVMNEATAFGSGIRILKQEPFEILISFIISQNCNIPRIKKVINTLCEKYGEEIIFEGKIYYAFPTVEMLASLSLCDIAEIKAGFRGKYIFDAVQKLKCKEVLLHTINNMPYDNAREYLKTIKGIGDKVANCILLFGFYKIEAFPVDVWIKRAIKEFYGESFDINIFGEHPGIAQQYLFYYAREMKEYHFNNLKCE